MIRWHLQCLCHRCIGCHSVYPKGKFLLKAISEEVVFKEKLDAPHSKLRINYSVQEIFILATKSHFRMCYAQNWEELFARAIHQWDWSWSPERSKALWIVNSLKGGGRGSFLFDIIQLWLWITPQHVHSQQGAEK